MPLAEARARSGYETGSLRARLVPVLAFRGLGAPGFCPAARDRKSVGAAWIRVGLDVRVCATGRTTTGLGWLVLGGEWRQAFQPLAATQAEGGPGPDES